MLRETLVQIYKNDLGRVIREIEAYDDEADLWKLEGEISNSGGNLALHLIGNINHFFGAVLGKTGYVRQRDLEFSDKNVSRAKIIEELNRTVDVLESTLERLSDEDLASDYPEDFGGKTQKTGAVAIYMLAHLNYHLGQINYHRRLLAAK